MVVELEIPVQPMISVVQRLIAVGVDLFILDRAPQAFHEDIVVRPSPTVHADSDPCLRQATRERRAGKLRTLIRIEDQRLTPPQRFLQAVEAKPSLQRVGDPPRQHLAAIPVQDRRQVPEPSEQPNVGDVNGLIANDKFCVSRVARLQLTWSRYEVWRQRTAAPKTNPSVEIHFCGGCHETTMADSPADDGVNGRPAAMGSSLPMAAGVEPTRDGPDRFTSEGDP